MRHYLYFLLWMCVVIGVGRQLTAQSLVAERQGNFLHLSAPVLHFLEGKPLEQLHNGASVTYDFILTIAADSGNTKAFHVRSRFIISFDLWEEKFSVVQTGPSGRSGSHMSVSKAEAWCLDNLVVPVPALHPDKPFVIRLDCWVVENEAIANGDMPSGITLAGLIDMFSRKGRGALPHWQVVSSPLRIADLPRQNRLR